MVVREPFIGMTWWQWVDYEMWLMREARIKMPTERADKQQRLKELREEVASLEADLQKPVNN